MSKSPRVNILIVTFNSGKYIQDTLESIFQQTYTDFSIYIYDNNSTDGTKEFLQSIKKVHQKNSIKIIDGEENIGPYKALNSLLKICDGEYIAIQDHDDIWFPTKLEKQVEFLDLHKEFEGCGTAAEMYYEADEVSFEYILKQEHTYAIHPSVVFRNKLQLKYNEEIDYMSDAYFLKYTVCNGEAKIFNLKEVLMRHIIKGKAGNYSYKWFLCDTKHIKRLYKVHGATFYTLAAFLFELQRKLLYPLLNKLAYYRLIASIERIPFRILGFKMKKQ